MKKLFAAALMAASFTASAAGPYDGIYVNLSGGFASIHTNGNSIIVIGLGSVPASNVVFSSILGSVRPTSIEQWDVGSGVINGNTVSLAGTAIYGACNYSMRITFNGAQAVAQIVGASNTPVGNANGVNCGLLTGLPASIFQRAF